MSKNCWGLCLCSITHQFPVTYRSWKWRSTHLCVVYSVFCSLSLLIDFAPQETTRHHFPAPQSFRFLHMLFLSLECSCLSPRASSCLLVQTFFSQSSFWRHLPGLAAPPRELSNSSLSSSSIFYIPAFRSCLTVFQSPLSWSASCAWWVQKKLVLVLSLPAGACHSWMTD